ncbi:MAG: 3-keto-disaccharide hydrolase [Candidatus Sumerlaeaceae bacterium]
MKNLTIYLAGWLASVTLASTNIRAQDSDGWIPLMDGKTFDGWKIAEPERNCWKVEDGAFVAKGERSHLFYVGEHQPFKDFELTADVTTSASSNGGIYFHTQWQDTGWPKVGYEIQVNQTHTDWRKSGSIYGVNDVKELHVKDNEWYTCHIKVQGKRITVKLNDKVVNDWTEEPDRKPGADFTRILTSGTLALQGHDPGSLIKYKNVRLKRVK